VEATQLENLESVEKSTTATSFPKHIASNAVNAAAFLDAISLFEISGARWMLSVGVGYWNEEIHEHTEDEVRHTKIVQDAAKKLRWEMNAEELYREMQLAQICYKETESYLSKLAKKIFLMTRRNSEKDFATSAYVLLAYLIERRIMKIYPHFLAYGATEGLQSMARELISDERKHLSFVNNKLVDSLVIAGTTKEEIVQFEENLFHQWMEKVIHVIGA
jgi:hypothetical protein